MAHYNERTGRIELSVEDEEIFAECAQNMHNKKTPITDSIMRSIIGTKKAMGMDDFVARGEKALLNENC